MTDAGAISRQAMRWMIFGEWRAYPGRVIVTAIVIAVGVALGFAVHLINASALNEFARAIRTVNGDADLQVQSTTPLGFDEALYPTLARLEGIAGASPVFEMQARLAGTRGNGGPDNGMTLLGIDIFRAANVTPSLLGQSAGSSDPFDPSAIFLSQAALDVAHLAIGDSIVLDVGGRTGSYVIAGTLPAAAEGQRLAVLDIAEAQWRFGRLGRLHRVDLKLANGVDAARVRDAISKVLPAGAEISDAESEAQRGDGLSRAYRVNLDMLALVALLSGAFLVYSAQSLSVARRRPQFALLRVLGVRRRALVLQVVIEGGVVGLIGAISGLALGFALAQGALRLLGGDLGAGYFNGATPELAVTPGAGAVFLVLGLAAALAGSALPAMEAARAQPAVALKNLGDTTDPNTVPDSRAAIVLLATGVGAALMPAINELPLFGYLSIGLLLAGGIAGMPLLARLLLAPLQRRAGLALPLDLALKRLWGAPSQAAIALCGIVASTSLVIAMAVMVSSFRGSVEDWLTAVLPSDLYLRIEGGSNGGIPPDVQQAMATATGLAEIHFGKVSPILLSPNRPQVGLVARDMDLANPERSLALLGRSLPVPQGATPIWLSEAAMRLYKQRPGDLMTLPLATTNGAPAPRFFIAGEWRDYGRQHGAIAMDNRDYTRLTGDVLRNEGAITLAPGARAEDVAAALRAKAPPNLAQRFFFIEPREIRASALRVFDRSFTVTYLLEAIALLVGLAGVAASFSAQTLARTKEFGMLRHIGVKKRQITLMLVGEGALLGIVGVTAGIGLGIAISQVLIHVVNPQSFHWTMDTKLPFELFAIVIVALVVAASGTALLAGRRALGIDAVRAVREDW